MDQRRAWKNRAAARSAFDNPDVTRFPNKGPDVQITSAAVIALGMTLNELYTNTTKFGALLSAARPIDIALAGRRDGRPDRQEVRVAAAHRARCYCRRAQEEARP